MPFLFLAVIWYIGKNEDWVLTSVFNSMCAISTSYTDNPKQASGALDKNHDGLCMTGGGGVVILEELKCAKACCAKIYSDLVGCSANSDGYDMVALGGTQWIYGDCDG